MADPIYTSASPIAVNPANGELIGGATFTVHAPDDTSFSTPLAVTDPNTGVAINPLRSNSNGTLPAFKVAGDLPRVKLKSGAFVTELVSLGGLVMEQVAAAGLDPETVSSAIAAGELATAKADAAAASAVDAEDAATVATQKASAVAQVVATNDGIMTTVLEQEGSAFGAAVAGLISDEVDLAALPVFAVDAYASPAAAYAALVAAGGGRLLFAPGKTYALTAGLVLNGAVPCEVVGTGALIIPPANGVAITLRVGRSNIPTTVLTGITINGNTVGGSAGGTVGVRILDHFGAVLRDVRVLNCGIGVQITDDSGWSESSVFDNVYTSNCLVGIDFKNNPANGGTGSFGYASWGLVHADNVPENGIGVRFGVGMNFYHSTVAQLVIHSNAASAIGIQVAGDIGINVAIKVILEKFGSVGTSKAFDIASTAVLDGCDLRYYATGWWRTFNNDSGVQYQARTGRTSRVGQYAQAILERSNLLTDSFVRWQRLVDGTQQWSSGSADFDTKLSRAAAGVLKSDGAFAVGGLTGAVQPSRWVGATASGAPTAGTFTAGDFVIDLTGTVWVCTATGTPGSWTSVHHATPAAAKSGSYYYASSPGSNATGVPPINTPRVSPLVLRHPVSVSRLAVEFTAAGSADSKFRIGIWADDGTGNPGALVVDAGTISTGTGDAGDVATGGTPGVYEVVLASPVSLRPGLYWVGGVAQGTTAATMRTILTTGLPALQLPIGSALPAANGTLAGFGGAAMSGALGAFSTPSPASTIPRVIYKAA